MATVAEVKETVEHSQAVPTKPHHAILVGDVHLQKVAQRLDWEKTFVSCSAVAPEALQESLRPYDPQDILIVSLQPYLDVDFLTWLDTFCEGQGICWVSFHLDQGCGWLGPLILPQSTANYRDLLVRRLATVENPEVHAAVTAQPLVPAQGLFVPAQRELLWMLGLLAKEIEGWLAGRPCHLLSAEIEADPVTLQLKRYPILPLPDHLLAGDLQIAGSRDMSLLVNERCGVIVRTPTIAHHPSIPKQVKTVQAHVSMMKWHYPDWPANPIASGSVFDDETAARQAAIGEAVERYCGNYMYDLAPIRASYRELQRRGEYALDPERVILYSSKMYRTPGCPFVPFTRDLPVHWAKGWSLTQDRPAWLPLSLVYIYTHLKNTARFPDEPTISDTFYPGVAAGASLEQALVSAIEEVIERDMMMIWWFNRYPLPAVQLSPNLEALWMGQPREMGQRAWLIPLPNEFGIPVMAGVLENVQERFLSIGFACRPDPIQAGLKAWTEAVNLQVISRDLDNPQGALYGVVETGAYNVFKPWRADRAYMDDYRDDYRDVIHLLNQSQFFLDPRAIEQVRAWVDVPATLTATDLPRLPDRSLATYRARIEARGYEIFYADLTTPDIAHTGLKAVRVLIPGLVPNFPTAFPPLGGGRVQTAPVQLGWRDAPLLEDDLNYMPMPYA